MTVDRRKVVAGVAASMAAGSAARAAPPKTRYAIVGVGHRSRMYQDALFGPYKAHGELVGVCDLNPGRVAYAQKRAADAGAPKPAGFVHTDFDRMIRETKPSIVIVTTPATPALRAHADPRRPGADAVPALESLERRVVGDPHQHLAEVAAAQHLREG